MARPTDEASLQRLAGLTLNSGQIALVPTEHGWAAGLGAVIRSYSEAEQRKRLQQARLPASMLKKVMSTDAGTLHEALGGATEAIAGKPLRLWYAAGVEAFEVAPLLRERMVVPPQIRHNTRPDGITAMTLNGARRALLKSFLELRPLLDPSTGYLMPRSAAEEVMLQEKAERIRAVNDSLVAPDALATGRELEAALRSIARAGRLKAVVSTDTPEAS